MRETWVQSLGWEELLEKEMATHSSILAWKIPWTEKPGRQQSMGSQRVGHDWATSHKSTILQLKKIIIFKISHPLKVVKEDSKEYMVAQTLKHLPTMRETWVQSLGREYPQEKEIATHSSTLAWKIPWTEKPGRLQSVGSQRVGHNWMTSLSLFLPLFRYL